MISNLSTYRPQTQTQPAGRPAQPPQAEVALSDGAQIQLSDGSTATGYFVNGDHSEDGSYTQVTPEDPDAPVTPRDTVVAYDSNGDGDLSAEEIGEGAAAMRALAGEDDLNGDGQVTADEREAAEGYRQRLDPDGDGATDMGLLREDGGDLYYDTGEGWESIGEPPEGSASDITLDPTNGVLTHEDWVGIGSNPEGSSEIKGADMPSSATAAPRPIPSEDQAACDGDPRGAFADLTA